MLNKTACCHDELDHSSPPEGANRALVRFRMTSSDQENGFVGVAAVPAVLAFGISAAGEGGHAPIEARFGWLGKLRSRAWGSAALDGLTLLLALERC